MSLGPKIRSIRAELANRRTERIAHRRLAAELAGFQTPSERAELDEVLARHTAEETREIRAILDQQSAARPQRPAFVSGYQI